MNKLLVWQGIFVMIAVVLSGIFFQVTHDFLWANIITIVVILAFIIATSSSNKKSHRQNDQLKMAEGTTFIAVAYNAMVYAVVISWHSLPSSVIALMIASFVILGFIIYFFLFLDDDSFSRPFAPFEPGEIVTMIIQAAAIIGLMYLIREHPPYS